ncbi:MAG TPA: dTMP kinase [Fimbriimonas sp.]|nr:dTMP kinase [Fimbriimonas sp.]
MFITFEGPEGAGKSTAIATAAEQLRSEGRNVLTTREPGAGEFGERIRSILLDGPDIDSKVELLLFLADRANHVQTVIKPALANGIIVLCDRFTDSTVVYQGHARGLDIEFIKGGNAFATEGLTPDLTILFDLDPEIGLSRLTSKDRLDAQPLQFHQRVRAGFLKEAHLEPRRFITIDASRPREQVLEDVVRLMLSRLPAISEA